MDLVKRGRWARLGREIHKHWVLYMFLLPCVASFIIFSYIPMVGILLAFKEFRFDMSIIDSPWVGFVYFERYFAFNRAWKLVGNTLALGVLKVFIEWPFPIIFAILINEITNKKFQKVTQTISYLPHFISMVVVASLVKSILAPDAGLVNDVIGMITGKTVRTHYLMDPDYWYPMVFFIDIWKGMGWGSIIYLAAIANIDAELYEAAKIDGANKLQQIWYITVSCIRPTMGILFILGLGGLLNSGYEIAYLLGTPGNAVVSEVLDLYVINVGLRDGQYGYATAVGLMKGVVGLILIVAANYTSKRVAEISVW